MWSADEGRDDLPASVVEHLAEPEGVLVGDATGVLKKGTKRATLAAWSGEYQAFERPAAETVLGLAGRGTAQGVRRGGGEPSVGDDEHCPIVCNR